MTALLIIYSLSVFFILYLTICEVLQSNKKTIKIKDLLFTCLLTLLPFINTIVALLVVIKVVDEYDKELKNPFYKEDV